MEKQIWTKTKYMHNLVQMFGFHLRFPWNAEFIVFDLRKRASYLYMCIESEHEYF